MTTDHSPVLTEQLLIAAVMVALGAGCFGLAFRSFYDGRQADGFMLLVVGVGCLTVAVAELSVDPLDGTIFDRGD